MNRTTCLAVLVGVVGCGGKSDEGKPSDPKAGEVKPADPKPAEVKSADLKATEVKPRDPGLGSVRVELGDCAGGMTAFVSGPQPGTEAHPNAGDRLVYTTGRPWLRGEELIGEPVPDARWGVGDPSDPVTSGWEKPGLRRYSGLGSGERPNPVPPSMSLRYETSDGDLDPAIIRRYVKRNVAKLQACYEKELIAKPAIGGTLKTSFTITAEGMVKGTRSEGFSEPVAACVTTVIDHIEFPKPKDGKEVKVEYRFEFRPGEPAPAPGIRPIEDPVLKPGTYQAGLGSPFRGKTGAIEACLHEQATSYGVIVVDLVSDATGAITKASAHGIDSEPAKACIVKLARSLKGKAKARTQRCGIAFGQMALAGAPGIDVTEDAVKLDGKVVASPAAIVANPRARIPAILDAIRAAVKASRRPRDVVSINGPYVVRAKPGSSMKVVNHMIGLIHGAEADVELAREDGEAWKALRAKPRALPEVPVAIGTARPRSGTSGRFYEVMTILVRKDMIWVGRMPLKEFVQIAPRAGELDWDRLETLLVRLKKGGFLEDSDIEISVEDARTYADVIRAVDTASKAGITNWEVVEPSMVSVGPKL